MNSDCRKQKLNLGHWRPDIKRMISLLHRTRAC